MITPEYDDLYARMKQMMMISMSGPGCWLIVLRNTQLHGYGAGVVEHAMVHFLRPARFTRKQTLRIHKLQKITREDYAPKNYAYTHTGERTDYRRQKNKMLYRLVEGHQPLVAARVVAHEGFGYRSFDG